MFVDLHGEVSCPPSDTFYTVLHRLKLQRYTVHHILFPSELPTYRQTIIMDRKKSGSQLGTKRNRGWAGSTGLSTSRNRVQWRYGKGIHKGRNIWEQELRTKNGKIYYVN